MNHHVHESAFQERFFPGSVILWVQDDPQVDWSDDYTVAEELTECPRLSVIQSEGYLKLSGLYVPKPARGQGVGEALLNKAKQIAKERKLPLYAIVEPFGDSPLPLADLLKWYGKQGFRRLHMTGPLAIVTIHPTRI